MKKNNTTTALIIFTVLVVGVLLLLKKNASTDLGKGLNSSPSAPIAQEVSLKGEEVPLLPDSIHIPAGEKYEGYNSNPPTSGPHYSPGVDWGVYDEQLPDEIMVHSLEHGGTWISYNNIDDKSLKKLKAIANTYPQAVVLSPRTENDTAIVLASWGRLEQMDVYDAERINAFIKANINNSPEKFASLAKVSVVLNKLAPEATFTTISGEELTLSELKGEKVMFWLLATWCPSCIAGAQVLEKNNDQLGDLTIIALETYGNAGYSGPTMKEFAEKNSPNMLLAPNWMWGSASKNTTEMYNPRNYPDIFFLVDENGVLRDIDTAPAATINKIINFANE